MSPLIFAYYCSGHGYGHATRVCAVATYLRQLHASPTVLIVSSAPQHVFSQAISSGALYRHADIDPVIVQPLAYHVDRRKSVDVLERFLSEQDRKIREEVEWLKQNLVDCVLSDAAFLACKAANAAGLPSVLITNFTFDSVYSYLSINLPSLSSPNPNNDPHNNNSSPLDDTPILEEELQPLVRELHEGYRCADLLLRLPGNIPIPSFGVLPPLPSHLWTVPEINRFHPEVLTSLSRNISDEKLHPQTHFLTGPKPLPRKIIQAPLIVRHPSEDIYTAAGRQRILGAVGVPDHLQTIDTKILIVSFGGQIFRRPQSRTPSRSHSPTSASYSHSQQPNVLVTRTASTESTSSTDSSDSTSSSTSLVHVVPPLVTDLHIWVPGAPPASKSPITPIATQLQKPQLEETEIDDDLEHESTFLPDDSWIAIVCGMTASSTDDSEELPRNFFVAPRDVYMPDLTAVADVLLGKLGYGTTAECVDAATPFVFVPRPLFVEEHGLRRLLEEQGTGVELTRTMYEAGDWKEAVSRAWELGREKKKARKELGLRIGADGGRRKEGEQMVHELIEWANAWRNAQ